MAEDNTNKTELVANCDRIKRQEVENRILRIRGLEAILDKDLAALYGVETKRLNEQVKRNLRRFPQSFRFQLTEEEKDELVASCNRLETLKHSYTLPYAYTEQGVAMLSAVLHSDEAIEISIRIIEAFVAMRHFLLANEHIFQRLDRIEYKQIEADHRIEELLKKIDERSTTPTQGIFFDGQIYDAYEFVCNLIKSANTRIVLIDNYIDDSVLTMLDKRSEGVSASIYTQQVSRQFKMDLDRHNRQYPAIAIFIFKHSHDRFLIIDDMVYLVGASLKDLGAKWFGITQMPATAPDQLIIRLNAGATCI